MSFHFIFKRGRSYFRAVWARWSGLLLTPALAASAPTWACFGLCGSFSRRRGGGYPALSHRARRFLAVSAGLAHRQQLGFLLWLGGAVFVARCFSPPPPAPIFWLGGVGFSLQAARFHGRVVFGMCARRRRARVGMCARRRRARSWRWRKNPRALTSRRVV